MQQLFSVSTRSRANNLWQACVLLLLGVVLLVVAWLGWLNAYPIGEVALGLGMLADTL